MTKPRVSGERGERGGSAGKPGGRGVVQEEEEMKRRERGEKVVVVSPDIEDARKMPESPLHRRDGSPG